MNPSNFSPGDLVTIIRRGEIQKERAILLSSDHSIPGEVFWTVFHFESNSTYRVFEKYLIKFENIDDHSK